MTNYPFETLDQVEDIESLNYAREALKKSVPMEKLWTASVSLVATMPVPQCNGMRAKMLVSQQVNRGWQLIQTTKNQRSRSTGKSRIYFLYLSKTRSNPQGKQLADSR